MPSKVRVRSPQSWYVPVLDPDTGKGHDIPCGIFGDATSERVVALKEHSCVSTPRPPTACTN